MRMHFSPLLRALLFAPAFALLAGCTGGDADLKDWIAHEKSLKGTPIAPLPVLKTFETFEYKDQELRDPFAPSLEEQQAQSTTSGLQPDKHPKEPLESYPLDSLKMVGSIGVGASLEALLRDTDGTVHRVHKGNYLGQNNGKVIGISETEIDLVELIPNGTGGWMERQASIALPEK
jgi:type IV pilus assembly protein PilP